MQRIPARLDPGEKHRVAAHGIGVRGGPRLGTDDFLEDQHVARGEMELRPGRGRGGSGGRGLLRLPFRRRALVRLDRWPWVDPSSPQRGRPRASGQATLPVAPGVEPDLVLPGIEGDLAAGDRLEGLVAAGRCLAQVRLAGHAGQPFNDRGEPHILGIEGYRSVGLEAYPGPGIAALVQRVVHQPGVAAHRDALPSGAQIGLGGDGVLVVAEMVAGVGEHLDDGDAQVRHVALPPLGHHQGQAVQHQLPEAGVVLGEIVDLRLVPRLRRAHPFRLAVQVARAVHLEGEGDAVVVRIERGMGPEDAVLVLLDDSQQVSGEVSFAVGHHVHGVVQAGHLGPRERHALNLYTPDPLAAFDDDVGGLQLDWGLP